MSTRILVTGGAGFIGSHTCKQLAAEGFEPVTLDNLSTGNRRAVKWGPLVEADIADQAAVCAAIDAYDVEAVIHFAASAYVGESVEKPGDYYRNNVGGTLSVLQSCHDRHIDKLVFSSSCATYGVPEQLPIRETSPQEPINPYGRTKLIGEWMISDFAASSGLKAAILRYFNACGADPDGELGEWHDPETHLVPRALMAASGKIDHLDLFGVDYPTPDGTCVRDYVHVSDLAAAHVAAVRHLLGGGDGFSANLGTGKGLSIREICAAVEQVTGHEVPLVIRDRRPGDPAMLVADATRAGSILGFVPRHSDIATIVATAAPFFDRGEANDAAA